MPFERLSTIIFVLTMHSTLDGNKQVGLHTFACGWNHTWKLHHTHGSKKIGLHPFVCATNETWKPHQHSTCNKKVGLHPFVCGANQTWKLYQHPMASRMWVTSICMWYKSYLKILSTPHGNKNVGCIQLYVVQIRLENCISTLWQQKNRVASNCMWCKLDLKIVLAPYGNKKIGLHPFVCGAN